MLFPEIYILRPMCEGGLVERNSAETGGLWPVTGDSFKSFCLTRALEKYIDVIAMAAFYR